MAQLVRISQMISKSCSNCKAVRQIAVRSYLQREYNRASFQCHNLHTSVTATNSSKDARQKVSTSSNSRGLTLSDSCVQQIKKISEGSSLRVVVESGGCSGFQYRFDLDAKVNQDDKFDLDAKVNLDDKVFERDGARVVIDADSLELLQGSVVDFKTELIRSAFTITDNPQAESGCSCGASFNVKI